jgi:hypothetical protein
MREGIPWIRPDRWTDPYQRLIRNTFHHDRAQAHQLGTQLRINLDTGQTSPPATVERDASPTEPQNPEVQ